MTVTRTFGSFAMTDTTNGVTVQSWSEVDIGKSEFSAKLGGDGSQFLREKREGRRVKLTGKVVGTSESDIRSKWDAFMEAVHNGEQYLSLFSGRQLLCRLEGSVDHSLVMGSQGTHYKWSLTFRSREPYWMSSTLITDTITLSGASPASDTLAACNGEAPTYIHYFKITNNGSTFLDKYLILSNTSSGGQLAIVGLSMLAGDIIVVDFLEGEITDGSSTPIQPANVHGKFWPLSGGGASDTIEAIHTIGAGMSLGVEAKWYDRYFGG